MPNEDEDLEQLKQIYDDLWADARSMIKDMGWSLDVYLVSGIFIFCFGLATIFVAIMLSTAPTITALAWLMAPLIWLTFLCGVCEIGFSIILLYWYLKLKGRYNKVIELEKTLGD